MTSAILKIALICFVMRTFAISEEIPKEQNFKNKVSVGLGGNFCYERTLPFGFLIGTDWKYKTVMEGGRFVYFDQQPDVWPLTLAHRFHSKWVLLDNRFSFFGTDYDGFSAKYELQARKQFRFENQWSLSPYVEFIEYDFDHGAYDEEWISRRLPHHAEFKSELGIDLEFLF